MASQIETNELLDRIVAGDAVAVDLLLNRYRGRLKQMLRVRMDERLAVRLDDSDVVQDTLKIACERLADYARERPVAFYPWLRAIALNRMIDLHRYHIKTQRRSVERELQLEENSLSEGAIQSLADVFVSREKSPSEFVERLELRERVKQALGKLSVQEREVVVMRQLEQMSVEEVADAICAPIGTVKSAQFRALRKLQILLKDES